MRKFALHLPILRALLLGGELRGGPQAKQQGNGDTGGFHSAATTNQKALALPSGNSAPCRHRNHEPVPARWLNLAGGEAGYRMDRMKLKLIFVHPGGDDGSEGEAGPPVAHELRTHS